MYRIGVLAFKAETQAKDGILTTVSVVNQIEKQLTNERLLAQSRS